MVAVARNEAGHDVSVLVESKVRLRPQDVRCFAGRCQRLAAEAGLTGPLLVYVYGLRVYEGSREAAGELGLGVLDYRGERVEPELRQMAS